ncbi:hypothetical protein GH714_040250 [Hevea brasiliensis]|uniref:BHLH domain-containing protein n=1 Tax=Hevea brasiliensis TaxID=3981 RepID=A0A6A6MTH3_HEVBR|nr:hypothetical protein GH714_040250 [Hevea brasiliensis]
MRNDINSYGETIRQCNTGLIDHHLRSQTLTNASYSFLSTQQYLLSSQTRYTKSLNAPLQCCHVPSHQNNQLSFQISSTPYQENTIPQDLLLILGHSTVDGIDPSKKNNMGKGRQRNPCLSHKKDENNTVEISTKGKRIIHRDIERRRRQEMATLYTSLRNLLPLEYIKGKRAISDHVQEAVKYTKDLQKKIEELSVRRDEMKNLSNLRVLDSEDES